MTAELVEPDMTELAELGTEELMPAELVEPSMPELAELDTEEVAASAARAMPTIMQATPYLPWRVGHLDSTSPRSSADVTATLE